MLQGNFQENTYDQHPPDREVGPTLLLVDDEPKNLLYIQAIISKHQDLRNIHVLHSVSVDAALEVLAKTQVHVVLLDKQLNPESPAPEFSGIEAIPQILTLQPHIQIIMVTGSQETQDIVRSIQLGALNYITKETLKQLLAPQLLRALDIATLKLDKVRRERGENAPMREMGGQSPVFQSILRQAEVLAESNRPLILLGETGTGKTELARWIHQKRGFYLKQKDRPFFSVNITTLSRNIIEGELFGYERGAFTDAHQAKQGLFELAHHGTLFLDEIGELPLDLQPKLLTVIEDGTFMRMGGSKMLRATPKLIFATNRNLEKMVEEGTFRKDLYMRISMFPIVMPRLSERKEDVPEIIRALLPRCCKENCVHVSYEEIPEDFINHLMNSSLDGNIRGIQHQLDRLLVLSPRDKQGRPVLTRWKLIPGLYQKKLLNGNQEAQSIQLNTPLTYAELMARPWDFLQPQFPGLSEMLEEIQKRLIHETVPRYRYKRDAAKALKISESKVSIASRNLDP